MEEKGICAPCFGKQVLRKSAAVRFDPELVLRSEHDFGGLDGQRCDQSKGDGRNKTSNHDFGQCVARAKSPRGRCGYALEAR